MRDCVFCKIVQGEVPAKVVAETADVLAFYDIDPSADTHVLIVPKKHIDSFLGVGKDDMGVVNRILRLTQQIIRDAKIAGKYKLVVNGGEYQYVPHLHWHLLGGEIKKNP